MSYCSLEELGQVINFDHPDGSECKCEKKRIRTLKVLHVNGTHRLKYYLCDFIDSTKRVTPEQLLANDLFPATHISPHWAFTFEVLSLYDFLDLAGFINIKQFVDGIIEIGGPEKGTDVRNKS